jgi:hypothetical protein
MEASAPTVDTSAAAADGVDLTETIYEDYFGFEETRVWYLPDGKQFIQFKVMDEGKKSAFQSSTNRDITVERNSGDARIKADPASERHALLEQSVIGWHMLRPKKDAQRPFRESDMEPVPFSGSKGGTFMQWVRSANPKLIEDLEFEIRKANPWLQAEMNVEEIDKEIDRLVELREARVKADAAKGSSSDK